MSKYISKDFCDERFQRVLEMLQTIDKKIDAMIAQKLKEAGLLSNNKTKSKEAFRSFLYVAVGGGIVAVVNYLLRLF